MEPLEFQTGEVSHKAENGLVRPSNRQPADTRDRDPVSRRPCCASLACSASAADAAHCGWLRGAQRDRMRAARLCLMKDEGRQLVLLRARLVVICETVARLRKERALMSAEPDVGPSRDSSS
jgi:hypothetical protein